MIFYFTLNGDSLKLLDLKTEAKTGNVNSYICKFQTDDDWSDLKVFASFKSGDKVYTVALSDVLTCSIPSELLSETGKIFIGLYATNFNSENFKRISTNWVALDILEGAYTVDSTAPAIPTPDVWEELASNLTPKIGENGNWYLWDMKKGKYLDTFVSARGLIDKDFEEKFYQKPDSDFRYLLKNNVIQKNNLIENISDYVPNSQIFDYQILGNSYQEPEPTFSNPHNISSVGDLVTDTQSEYFGKYHIPYTLNKESFNLYLDNPLRGLMHYGTLSKDLVGQYDYTSDNIDFKNQSIIRTVGELIIDDISFVGEQDPLGYIVNDELWVRTFLCVPEMSIKHPTGRWICGDTLSDRFQSYLKTSYGTIVSDNYLMTKNDENNLYFYWNLSLLGFSYELGDETDFLLKTVNDVFYKVKDENSNYLTDISQIRERISILYGDKPVKIYYPLASPKSEPLDIPPLFMSESGTVDFSVKSELSPREINFSYYVDITEKFTELRKRVDDLEAAILSMGADI